MAATMTDLDRLTSRIARLTADRDAMQRRALSAEGEAAEARLRIAELERQLEKMQAAYPGTVCADGEDESAVRYSLIEIDEVRR